MGIVNTNLADGVFEIELNRPDRINAFNRELGSEMYKVVLEAKENPEVRAVLLYGKGRGFCSGGDLKDFGVDTNDPVAVKEFMQDGQRAILWLYQMEKPVIAAVHGAAAGAGCNLAFACDIIIAEENAVFSETFSKVGALPDLGGLYFLPQKVGMHIASELIFTGKKITAKEALDYRLINRVVKNGQAVEEARDLAVELAAGPTKVLGMAKKLMHQAPYSSLEELLEKEAMGQAIIFQSKDFKEGRQAFNEKRQPRFEGK
ncbi:enoyl-CoA hydratase/isomerase family protein [Oceanobacillus salinisoli]|uniref:enoyl-CoA hydratase/isomerase family protein n=1 Tax=Oceanobacillus salinisoli TaxID=2678611 RepID=UPI0012E1CE05|nr:enoyl-CoA hydratase-related protein [Oceanobacillus salinisoli]